MKKVFDTVIEMKTVSESNCSEHWSKKYKRHQSQKSLIRFAFSEFKNEFIFPCHVKLTRISPRELDAMDNLPMSFKWITDSVAEMLTNIFVPGRADGDKRITWEYHQIKGKPQAIKIEIFHKTS